MLFHRLFLASLMVLSMMGVFAQQTGEVTLPTTESTPKKTYHTITAEAGPAWITSKVYDAYGDSHTWRTGVAAGVEYTCVFSSGYGFGLTYTHDKTGYPESDITLNYIGPSMVYSGYFSQHWRAQVSWGLGYGTFKTYGDKDSGLGIRSTIGVERMMSAHFGIGARIHAMSIYMGENDDLYPGNPQDRKGVSLIGLNLTISYHL